MWGATGEDPTRSQGELNEVGDRGGETHEDMSTHTNEETAMRASGADHSLLACAAAAVPRWPSNSGTGSRWQDAQLPGISQLCLQDCFATGVGVRNRKIRRFSTLYPVQNRSSMVRHNPPTSRPQQQHVKCSVRPCPRLAVAHVSSCWRQIRQSDSSSLHIFLCTRSCRSCLHGRSLQTHS